MITATNVVRKSTMHEIFGIRRKVKGMQQHQEASKMPSIKKDMIAKKKSGMLKQYLQWSTPKWRSKKRKRR